MSNVVIDKSCGLCGLFSCGFAATAAAAAFPSRELRQREGPKYAQGGVPGAGARPKSVSRTADSLGELPPKNDPLNATKKLKGEGWMDGWMDPSLTTTPPPFQISRLVRRSAFAN